ncbi:hypothetical protein CCGE531_09075 [Rhizobium sp. CCGE531]|nr:hypothetical protein CCGE531_09075 [Rhizobium sp. CCGE531]
MRTGGDLPDGALGFFDDFLIEQWWSRGDDAPIFIGGAVAQFPDGEANAILLSCHGPTCHWQSRP